jgi:hypothetical protein
MKLFYSHIVKVESVMVKLDELDLDEEQKKHLAQLVDSTVHHTVLGVILSRLSDDDKRLFIKKLEDDPHDKALMEFVKERVENIEEEIARETEKLIEELHEDIKQSHIVAKESKND